MTIHTYILYKTYCSSIERQTTQSNLTSVLVMTIITAAALILHPLLLYLSYLVLGTVSASPTTVTVYRLFNHPLLLYLSYLVLGTVSASPTTVTVYRLFTLIENPPSFTKLRAHVMV